MREVTGQRIATFSIGFGQAAPSYDELPYARMVAERFETDHHEEILEPKVSDLLPTIVHHFDEPFADSSAIPTFVVAQATAQHVKVALSGIGGDELPPLHWGPPFRGLWATPSLACNLRRCSSSPLRPRF
jgi:asparagine synthase (glutamine-hydrolysing)